MKTGRRIFISSFAAALAATKPLLAGLQRHPPPIQFPQTPDGDASGRAGGENFPAITPPDPKARLKESQKNLRRDADRLLELAQNLKDEADKTEQTDVLSLSLVKKAEEVEKLAHQIKDLVRSS